MTGKVHSLQTMGAVDGPGIRYVIFLQGCPLRCAYCHNPDTWTTTGGTLYETNELIKKIKRYRDYFGRDGGVTVSGGEALLQADFVSELFSALHREGINTCLDTSGNWLTQKTSADITASADSSADTIAIPDNIIELLRVTDLVICDIKFISDELYHKHSYGSLNQVLSFLLNTEKLSVPLWVRHVVVPGLTDTREEISAMSELAHRFSNLKRIELLPFHKLCIPKYEALGIPFPLADTEPCSVDVINKLNQYL